MSTQGTEKRTIAYLRVSTVGQNNGKFKNAVLDFANKKQFGHVEFVKEKISGKVSWEKRKIKSMIDNLNAGDRIIVPELSRLGRDRKDVFTIASILIEKKIELYAIKENFQLDESPVSKIFITVMSLANELERDFLVERTKEGLKAAKKNGKTLGRPKGTHNSRLDPYKDEIKELLINGASKTYVAKRYKLSLSTFHGFLKKHGIHDVKKLRAEAQIGTNDG